MVVTIAIAGGYLLMRRALRPVDEITQSAERITSRNLSERLPAPKTGDEIERLSVGLNRMIARLDESFQHIHRFSADASHELRTPLTILRGELEAAVQQPQITPELRETLGSALEETERLSRIVESLMAIARLDAGEAKVERAHFDLAELTSTMTEQMRLLAEDKNIALRCEAKQRVGIEGDRSRLKQVIVNLVDNAIKYTPAGGHVGVKVYASNGCGVLEVNDNGVGIPAESLPHIFERFYRVDKARSRQMGGAGLGLSIIKAIVMAHGGQVKQIVRAAQANVERMEVFAKAVQVLVDSQLRPGVDASRANAELAAARNQLIQARQDAEISQASLAEAIGQAGATVAIDAGSLLTPPLPPSSETPDFAAHPLARAQAASLETAQARERVLDRSYFPRFDFQSAVFGRGTGARIDGSFDNGKGLYPNTGNWAVGMTITFPAFDIFEVAEAQRLLAQAEADDAVARLAVWRALLIAARAHGDLQPFLEQVAKTPIKRK